jgi:hypothetical protein
MFLLCFPVLFHVSTLLPCPFSCFYFALRSFFMFLICCPVIFHVSTLLPCHFSCFYFAALSFSCFYFAALSFPHSWLITEFTTRLTRWVPLVDKQLLTLPEDLRSPPVFSGVHVTRPLVLCVFFIDRCWSFCPFSFDHCAVCPSFI